MNCSYSEKILLYFYGETDEAQAKEIKEHLSSCPECENKLEVLNGVSQHLEASKVQPPEYLVEDIIRQSRKEESPKYNIGKVLENMWSLLKILSMKILKIK
jgi:predicted anti-sigma-YlaC factor YlaD